MNETEIRIRHHDHYNLRAIFTPEGRTYHMKLRANEPFGELPYPLLYDVAINNKCFGGCTEYCYVEAMKTGENFEDIVAKAKAYFGEMSMNERPFQIAIGGAGEPTLHPDFPAFLEALRELKIMPNYTTNGMHLSPAVMEATVKHAGGVAVTLHRHLERHWRRAIPKLTEAGVRTNLHIIPMSLDDVEWVFNTVIPDYQDTIEYFVILPYQSVGWGKPIDMTEPYKRLFAGIEALPEDVQVQVAYGAYFYDELHKRPHLKAGLYPERAFSKYLVMKDTMSLYGSSFEWKTPLKTGLLA